MSKTITKILDFLRRLRELWKQSCKMSDQ